MLTRQSVAEFTVDAEGPAAGASLLAQTDPRVEITAIRCTGRAEHLEVRLVNLSDDDVTEVLNFGVPVVDAEKTSFLGGPLALENDPVFVSDGGRKIKVPLAPYEIATLVVELEPS